MWWVEGGRAKGAFGEADGDIELGEVEKVEKARDSCACCNGSICGLLSQKKKRQLITPRQTYICFGCEGRSWRRYGRGQLADILKGGGRGGMGKESSQGYYLQGS